jgi:UDP-N-acetyl-2-amino-2-deoxyglucuronate dehydrogenase
LISLAIIGCGRVTRIAHLSALEKLSDRFSITAVCDVSEAALEEAVQKTGARGYAHYETLLKKERPDLLVLNVANGLHAPMAHQAIEAGIKAIAIEKPLAMSLKEADSLIEAADRAGVKLFTILQNRYNPPVKRLKEALETGRMGRLLSVQMNLYWHREKSYYEGPLRWHADREMAGGVLTNQAVHYFDLLLHLSDQQPVSAYAVLGHRFGLAVEDYGAGVIRFDRGLIAAFSLSNHAQGEDREGSITLIGEKATVKIGGKALNRIDLWAFDEPIDADATIAQAATEPPTVYGFGHFDFYQAVACCLESGDCAAAISGCEGRRSVALLAALYASAKAQKPLPVAQLD